jgi:hypothetical protein
MEVFIIRTTALGLDTDLSLGLDFLDHIMDMDTEGIMITMHILEVDIIEEEIV